MTRDEAKLITNKVLDWAAPYETNVWLSTNQILATRYANNAITQNQEKELLSLTVSVAQDSKVGACSTESFDEENIKKAVQRAKDICRLSRPDPEYLPPLEPVQYPEIPAFVPTAQNFDAHSRTSEIAKAVAVCKKHHHKGAGVFTVELKNSVVANSNGLFGFHDSSLAYFTVTAMTDDSSGWAEECHENPAMIDAVRAAERASLKAEACINPRKVEARKYQVLLEPAAVADLLVFLMWHYDARPADEKRSFMAGKIGAKIVDSRVSLFSDPVYPGLPGTPFNPDGLPAPKVHWIRNGVAETLRCSRYWAAKTGRQPVGMPSCLVMNGGADEYPAMIEAMNRGLVITRFWYIRVVDPMTLLLTGITRDSTCLVEGGRKSHGVLNLRFNESPLTLMQNVEMMSEPVRVGNRYIPVMMPAMLVKDFNFTSTTLF